MKNNWRNPGTNRFKNDIYVLRKKAGENLDEYIYRFYLLKNLLEAFLRMKMKKNDNDIVLTIMTTFY